MNITSKSRYALKIMMDLAERSALAPTSESSGLAQRSDIAARQGIPLDYMDHILSRLREASLIASTRGRSGGYRLARKPDEVSMLEIFTAVEDAFQPVQCLDGGTGCSISHHCSSRDAWSLISGAISQSLSGIILADVVHRKQALPAGLISHDAQESRECRAPARRRAGATREQVEAL